jgi:glycosyltransferase involved in cell wall biosynthesis
VTSALQQSLSAAGPELDSAPVAPASSPPGGSLVVFSDDWGRHPSSCQHLIHALAPRYDVLWVNTIGTRGPKLDWATLHRAAGKLLPKRAEPPELAYDDHTNVQVVNPLMWPWFRHRHDRWLNRRALVRALARRVAALPRPRIVVTTIPLVADLVGELDVDAWAYYCVDDMAAWPGLESDVLRQMEGELLAKVDVVVAVSKVLQDRVADAGRKSTVVLHGVNLDHWRRPEPPLAPMPELASAAAPRITFWGLIDERLDAEWLLALASSLQEGSVVIAGPCVTVDPRLQRHPRVALPGAMTFDDLPALAAHSAALVMPYQRMPATEAMQPLKLNEYLATGLPCIVRKLPATEPWHDAADVVDSCDEFVRRVHERIRTGLPADQRAARGRLVNETWEAKARDFERAIRAGLPSTDKV